MPPAPGIRRLLSPFRHGQEAVFFPAWVLWGAVLALASDRGRSLAGEWLPWLGLGTAASLLLAVILL